jgi:hypothetical protein
MSMLCNLLFNVVYKLIMRVIEFTILGYHGAVFIDFLKIICTKAEILD